MRAWYAVPSAAVERRIGRLDRWPRPQQASPAARTAAAARNWCLRSRRIRRVAQGRTSLPYPTPLLLSCSGQGQRHGQRADEHKEPIRQRVVLARQEHLPGGQDQEPHGSLQAAFSSGPVGSSLSSSITPPWCHLPVPGQGWQRLAAKAVHPVKGWQTQAFGGLLNTQPANPSVKGTGLRPAPYVER